MIPIVVFDQIYNFSRDALIEAIPRPEQIQAQEFANTGISVHWTRVSGARSLLAFFQFPFLERGDWFDCCRRRVRA
jgi:hypothetical protein